MFEMQTAFITRALADDSDFRDRLEKAGWMVNSQSFVKFEAIPFETPNFSAFDWIFFSSQQAVHFFFSQIPPIFFLNTASPRWAALGTATARVLSGYTGRIDFTGTGEPIASSSAFADVAAGARVLFPGASQSRESVQIQLKTKVVATTLAIYHNTPIEGLDLRTEPILVFTSPMNVSAYFSQHALLPYQQCVAIGKTTRLSLQEQGVKTALIAEEPTEKGLAETVVAYLNTLRPT